MKGGLNVLFACWLSLLSLLQLQKNLGVHHFLFNNQGDPTKNLPEYEINSFDDYARVWKKKKGRFNNLSQKGDCAIFYCIPVAVYPSISSTPATATIVADNQWNEKGVIRSVTINVSSRVIYDQDLCGTSTVPCSHHIKHHILTLESSQWLSTYCAASIFARQKHNVRKNELCSSRRTVLESNPPVLCNLRNFIKAAELSSQEVMNHFRR